MTAPPSPGKFETWIQGRLPLGVVQPRSGSTGAFEARLSNRQPIPVLAIAAAAGNVLSGAIVLPGLSESGVLAETFTFSGAVVLLGPSPSGVIAETFTASGAVVLHGLAESGVLAETFTASGAVVLPGLSVAGSLTMTVAGFTLSGAIVLPGVIEGGTLVETFVASGAVSLAGMSVAGVLAESFVASGAIVLPGLSEAGVATQTFIASGAIVLPGLSITGALNTALMNLTLSGDIVLPGLSEYGVLLLYVPPDPPVLTIRPLRPVGVGSARSRDLTYGTLVVVANAVTEDTFDALGHSFDDGPFDFGVPIEIKTRYGTARGDVALQPGRASAAAVLDTPAIRVGAATTVGVVVAPPGAPPTNEGTFDGGLGTVATFDYGVFD